MSPCRRFSVVQKRLANSCTTCMACICFAVTTGMAGFRWISGVPTSGALTSWHMGLPFEKKRVGPNSR